MQAFSGLMSMTGDASAPLARVAASVIDLSTGMWAAIGIMAALAERARSGEGRYVEATLIDSGHMLLCHQITSMRATGVVPGRSGSASPIAAPCEAFETADGWLMITAGNDAMFARLCEALALDDLAEREQFRTTAARVAHRDELHRLLQARLAHEVSSVWMTRLTARSVPVAPVQNLSEAVHHPLMAERAMLAVATGAAPGTAPVLRLPIDDARPPALRAAPQLGEHSADILREAGFDDAEIAVLIGG